MIVRRSLIRKGFRDLIRRTVDLEIANISYIGTKFWNSGVDGKQTLNGPAWIGVCQMFFMVVSWLAQIWCLGAFPVSWRLSSVLTRFQCLGAFPVSWRTPSVLTQFQCLGALPVSWRVPSVLAQFQCLGAFPVSWRNSSVLAPF